MTIVFDPRIGQNNSIVGGITLAVVVPAAGVPVGDKVVVVFSYSDNGTGLQPTCADNKGNVYAVDFDGWMTTNGNKRLLFFSTRIANALVSGDVITVIHNSQTLRCMDVFQVSGLGTEKDRVTTTQVSTSTAVSTGNSELRRSINQMLITAVSWRGVVTGDTFTAGANFLAANLVEAAGAGVNLFLATEYQIVSAVGVDAGTGTIGPAARGWIGTEIGYAEPGISFGGDFPDEEDL